ncbi:MAG: hypothetical protein HOM21_08340, partial [Halobacteriovoraceae bacterium]|nr:hypothetical protein [Halobacteriovoraceae bacterium]
YSFLRFVISPIKATLRVIERGFYDSFGENQENRKSLKIQTLLFNCGILARVVFLFLLLGPVLFCLLYLPIYLANIFVFAHINYATHIENSDGSSEIINLKDGVYYRFVNTVSLGGYFHKSHHLKPQNLNPANVKINNEKKYITYVPEFQQATPPRKPLYHMGLINGLKGIKYAE